MILVTGFSSNDVQIVPLSFEKIKRNICMNEKTEKNDRKKNPSEILGKFKLNGKVINAKEIKL